MADAKGKDGSRWVQVGALWDERGGGLTGTVSLGILGEVRILIRPNSNRTNPRAPGYNIIAKAEDLPLNRLADDAPPPMRVRYEPAPPKEANGPCGEVHPQRADCLCTLPSGHDGDHRGTISGGEVKTWISDIPF